VQISIPEAPRTEILQMSCDSFSQCPPRRTSGIGLRVREALTGQRQSLLQQSHRVRWMGCCPGHAYF
jgi:hypothetical protein